MALSVLNPWMLRRCIHDFAPRGDARRYNPCSSVSLAGPFAVSIRLTVSFANPYPNPYPDRRDFRGSWMSRQDYLGEDNALFISWLT